jgi:hypothetical protein
MTLRATRTVSEILGRGATARLRVTRLLFEVLGCGDNDRVQTTRAGCEILGEWVAPACRVSRLDSEVLGRGEDDRVQSTQIGCEILGELIVSTLRVSALNSEILGRGDNDCIQATQVGCEILGEWVIPSLRVASVNLELLGDSPPNRFGSGMTYYGTLIEADSYFGARLHESAWFDADPADRPKALWAATQIIDTLNFKGQKNPVYVLLQQNPQATSEQIRAAEASQVLEFPRDADTEVPEAIRQACYEIAHSLLDGKDPELELEALGIASQGYSSVKTTYAREQVPIEHIVNGVPNAMAWRLLRPFLRDADGIKFSRIS